MKADRIGGYAVGATASALADRLCDKPRLGPVRPVRPGEDLSGVAALAHLGLIAAECPSQRPARTAAGADAAVAVVGSAAVLRAARRRRRR
ncbi:MAG: hypothetical protein ACYDB7_15615 [Mycobacteriales bacterium]